MPEAKAKTTKYKVKSHITRGVRNPEQDDPSAPDYYVNKEFNPGSTIELTLAEAVSCSHALENGPRPVDVDENGEESDLDEDEDEAIESIRRRPDNPDSGVQQHWKTDRIAVAAETNRRSRAKNGAKGTKAVGHGFERASAADDPMALTGAGLNAPGTANAPRPETNISEMEREQLEEQEKQRAADEKKAAAAAK